MIDEIFSLISRNISFEIINAVANILIGITAIISLWFSVKALKKSEWDSAMNTAPSLVLRPTNIWVGVRASEIEHGYMTIEAESNINANHKPYEVVFTIEFECFNAGRGAAFNISQPNSKGMPISEFRTYRAPLYQTLEDEPFRVELQMKKKFEEWHQVAEKEMPVHLEICYTNDQNNVFCRSSWQANIRPFDRNGNNVKVREIRLLNRKGKIEYSQTSYGV